MHQFQSKPNFIRINCQIEQSRMKLFGAPKLHSIANNFNKIWLAKCIQSIQTIQLFTAIIVIIFRMRRENERENSQKSKPCCLVINK